ncbi:hypothetical protein ScPMuIL_016113 [Solemya velum]
MYKRQTELSQSRLTTVPVLDPQYCFIKPFVAHTERNFYENGEVFSDRPAGLRFIDGESRGIAGTSGELWKIHRKFAMTTLRNFGMGKTCMESTIKSEIGCLLETIKMERGQPIDLADTIHISIANIICAVAFSKRFEDGDGEFLGLWKNIEDLLKRKGVTVGLRSKFLEFLPIDIFGIKHFQSIFKQTNDYLREVYEEHVQTFDGDRIRDYTDAFIQEQKSAELNGVVSDFTVPQALGELTDLFQAGTETTATTLRWALLYMLKYPETQDKIRAEIDEFIGSGNAPSLKDRSIMHYTEAFISETLRFACIVPMAAPHCATRDFKLGDLLIPKASIVVPNLESVLSDPEIWENPDQFSPERFLDENGRCIQRDELIPFSLGPRVCLGQSLARMELFLFLTILVQQFIFTRPDDEKDTPLDIVGVRGIVHIPTPYRLCAKHRL